MSSALNVHPDLFEILNAAIKAPHEYRFDTRSEATTLRHRLYTARRKLMLASHPLGPAFSMLSISVPRERQSALSGGTEWYWTIGEGVIYSSLRAQLDAHLAKAGQVPQEQANESALHAGVIAEAHRDDPPALPQHTSAQTDAAMRGFVPSPRPPEQRESTSNILDEMAAALHTFKCERCKYVWQAAEPSSSCPECPKAVGSL